MNSDISSSESAAIAAIQGIRGSYHDLAARRIFGEGIQLLPCRTFRALFAAVGEGRATYGLVAIENSVAGTLLPNYALLRESGLRISDEIRLRIKHVLMTLPGQQLSDITEVHSHPMALQQCTDFWAENPQFRLIERSDTAAAAQKLAQDQTPGIAVVASGEAATAYGLEPLAVGIEDNPQNYTRFLVVQPESTLPPPPQSGKASLCFRLSHEIGSLAHMLTIFSSHGLNLTKIQSSPVPRQPWEYFFHLDVEYEELAQLEAALVSASRPGLAEKMQILGRYVPGATPTLRKKASSSIPTFSNT